MTSRTEYPVFKILEEKSKFFCPAKWTELYLYLNHGNSNSCHHPIPHRIPLELLENPSVLHNTPHKLKMQQLMMDGHRPDECHMCWHVEDLDPDVSSDRILKSEQYINDIENLSVDPNYVPKFIEIIFDNVCNLSCSYCDSGQSSVWATRVQQDPVILKTDYRKSYLKQAISKDFNSDPYYNSWITWWKNINHKVETLRLSGGEPMISKRYWHFINEIGSCPQLNFALNSNMMYDTDYLDDLKNRSKDFKSITIGASVDASGDIAEYSRQGLNYTRFVNNINYWLSISPENCYLNLQGTVNVFNIWDITSMFDLSIELKKKYPNKVQDFYLSIVRIPEFQSIAILGQDIKHELKTKIQSWLDSNQTYLSPAEQELVHRIVVYLDKEPELVRNLSPDKLQTDLAKFINWYDKYSIKKFKDVYPKSFSDWVYNI